MSPIINRTLRSLWGMNQENPGPSNSQLERFWESPCDLPPVILFLAFSSEYNSSSGNQQIWPSNGVDLVIVVDDRSQDETATLAQTLCHTRVWILLRNSGYGANQKTCHRLAMEERDDIIIMIHSDYQYAPKLIPAMVSMIGNNLYHCVLGSRILGGYALKGGIPLWKYMANRLLTLWENLLLGAKLSENDTECRAYSRGLVQRLPFHLNSDDFVFDNQTLAQFLWYGYTIAETGCPTVYATDSSCINFRPGAKYGLGCLSTALSFRLPKFHLIKSRLFLIHA